MKNSFLKIQSLLILIISVFTLFSCSNGTETKYVFINQPSVEEKNDDKTYPVNVLNNVVCKEVMQGRSRLFFKEGAEDIPYVNINELSYYYDVEYPEKYKVLITANHNNYTSTVLIDLNKRTISFSNYDHYISKIITKTSKTFLDAAGVFDNDFIKIEKSFNSWGFPIVVNFSEFEDYVLCVENNGNLDYFISLNAYGNLFTNNSYVYNGKEVYSTNSIGNNIRGFYRMDEGTGKKMRSEALTDFTYKELCINLDLNYGLKKLHGNNFPSFDSYFEYIGLKNKLLNPDPEIFCKALWDLCEAYFSDNHSKFVYASYYCGLDIAAKFGNRIETGDETLITGEKLDKNIEIYKKARERVYGTEIPGLEFSDDGKTAIVRFDEFTIYESPDLNIIIQETEKNLVISPEEINEFIKTKYNMLRGYVTTDYFLYCVNKMIKENPSVENVVLDLSCNTGGTVRAAIATLAWMLGEIQLNVTNSVTDAKTSSVYVCDLNGDGLFDENDTIADKKLFCLISPVSFSCGNTVASMLKASNRVVMLGETTGGGSAFVYNTMAADSTCFRISSKYITSENKNGSNYNIDKGVEPHVRLQPETLYNREKICSIVANMD